MNTINLHPEMQAFLAAGNTKPVVHYTPKPNQYIPTSVGHGAYVFPIDHPNHLPSHRVSNTTGCFTSEVIRIGEEGEFETLNTIYKPSK